MLVLFLVELYDTTSKRKVPEQNQMVPVNRVVQKDGSLIHSSVIFTLVIRLGDYWSWGL